MLKHALRSHYHGVGQSSMTVLNTFLAVAGWVWTALVVFFAAGYAVGYKAALRESAGGEAGMPRNFPEP
jgi:hypothetical protein